MTEVQAGEVAALLAACAQVLRTELEQTKAYWSPDEPPPTVALAALGTAVVVHQDAITDDELSTLADTVEQVLEGSAENAKDATATGFLEAVLTATQKSATLPRFLPKLGERARNYCQAWDAFTGVRTPGL